MHTEPELAISVQAKEFLNQIEVIRMIANSLPTGMSLLIKEHPATLGRRKLSYYKQLSQVPNVIMLSPNEASFDVIDRCAIVFVITGTTAYEAIYQKRPVIYFGSTHFSFLPKHVVQKADVFRLNEQIKDFLKTYRYDEQAILSFIAAVMDGSVRANLITEVIKKGNRMNLNNERLSYDENINRLATEFRKRISEEIQK